MNGWMNYQFGMKHQDLITRVEKGSDHEKRLMEIGFTKESG